MHSLQEIRNRHAFGIYYPVLSETTACFPSNGSPSSSKSESAMTTSPERNTPTWQAGVPDSPAQRCRAECGDHRRAGGTDEAEAQGRFLG